MECEFGIVFLKKFLRVHICLARLLSERVHWLFYLCNLFCKPFIAFLRRSLANEQILLIRKTLLYQNTIFYWYWVIWINVEECLPVDFFSAYFCTWFVVDYIQFSILERRAGQIYFRELNFSESQFYLHARSGTQKRTCKIKVNVHIWSGNN